MAEIIPLINKNIYHDNKLSIEVMNMKYRNVSKSIKETGWDLINKKKI